MSDSIEDRMQRLERSMKRLELLLEDQVVPECRRMGEHISFIEDVYQGLRRPLAALRNWGERRNALPSPKVDDID